MHVGTHPEEEGATTELITRDKRFTTIRIYNTYTCGSDPSVRVECASQASIGREQTTSTYQHPLYVDVYIYIYVLCKSLCEYKSRMPPNVYAMYMPR